MVRSPCCSKMGLNQGAWTACEDFVLSEYIKTHGHGRWRSLPKEAGLNRCGKSCRLRWLNYLRPDIKRGNISSDEEELILRLHRLLGNRWSLIAGRLPGRTDNEIKNYWNTRLIKRRERSGKIEKAEIFSMKGSAGSSGEDDEEEEIVKPKPVRGCQVAIPKNNYVSYGDPVNHAGSRQTLDEASKSLCKLLLDDSEPNDFQLVENNSVIFQGSTTATSTDTVSSQNLFNLNELPNTSHGNVFSIPSDFKLDDYEEGISEIYSSTQHIDWINELEYI